MSRYEWRKPSDLPDRLELIDRTTHCVVATIISVGRNWQWQRKTSVLLHGAPPVGGTSARLSEAKLRVIDGLPD